MGQGRMPGLPGKLLNLLVTLIEDFEDKHYQVNASTPGGILGELMESKNIQQKDLVAVFGSASRGSEAVNGRREISKAQARDANETRVKCFFTFLTIIFAGDRFLPLRCAGRGKTLQPAPALRRLD